MTEPTDHESILLLTKAVDNLSKRLDEKLGELKMDIRELRDNYANRLSNAEKALINIERVKVAKEEQDEINKCFVDDINRLKLWRSGLAGATGVIIPVLCWLVLTFLEQLIQ